MKKLLKEIDVRLANSFVPELIVIFIIPVGITILGRLIEISLL